MATHGSKSARVRELLRLGKSASEIAKEVGCTVGLVYNVKSRLIGTARAPQMQRAKTMPSLDGFIESVRKNERERVIASLDA